MVTRPDGFGLCPGPGASALLHRLTERYFFTLAPRSGPLTHAERCCVGFVGCTLLYLSPVANWIKMGPRLLLDPIRDPLRLRP